MADEQDGADEHTDEPQDRLPSASDQHVEIGAALDRIEAGLDEVAAALSRMA